MSSVIEEMRSAGGLVGVPDLLCLLAEAQLAAGLWVDARRAKRALTALEHVLN